MTPNRLAAIAFRWLISAVLTLWVFSPNARAQSAATAINGVYNGTYNCAIGPRTLKLSLLASGNGSLTGVFTFYLPPASHTQAFSYSLNGTFDAASGKFKLNPVKWESPPPGGYSMVGMDGAFDPGSGQVAGKITNGSCGAFQATRDQAESANIASVIAPQKTAGAAQPLPKTVVPAAPPSKAAAADSPPPPPRMASASGNTDSDSRLGSVALIVCNAGKVDIDVFVAQSGKVSSAHIGAANCAFVAKSAGSMGPAYVGLAFVDARGQWGAARRQDLLPDFGIDVLTRADRNVPVGHGNTTVSLPMQLLFRPRDPTCTTPESHYAESRLPYNATATQRSLAVQQDINASSSNEPSCEMLSFVLNVVAYPDSREITFNNFCDPCEKKAEARLTPEERAARQQRSKAIHQEMGNLAATGSLGALAMDNMTKMANQQAQEDEREREQERREQRPESYQRMNWNEMNLALAHVHGSGGRPPEMPQYLIIRGTVSRVDVSPPGASEHWVDVYFRESSEQASTSYETSYGAFNVCASNAEIFEDMFGPDFRSRMIGQVLEVRGEYQSNYCKGWKGSIRVTLARQLHSAGSKSGNDQTPADSGISYGDFLKALAKAQDEEPKKPPVVSMQTQMAERDQEDNRKRWAGSHQSPASYDPQWMGQNIVVTGTVSRVDVDSSRSPHWMTIYFKESPDATFVVCSPYPDMFQERVGLDLSALVGKTLQAAGQVEGAFCGNKVPKGSIRVVESKQWQVQ